MSGSAKAAIFAALATGKPSSDAASIDAAANALLAEPDHCRPVPGSESIVDAFINRVNGPKVAAMAHRLADRQDVPDYVRRFLDQRDLPRRVCLQPTNTLSALNWQDAGIEPLDTMDDGVAVAEALWGIAETGTVAIHSGRDSPILLHFLPAISLVVVSADRLLWYLEDYAAEARESGDATPRNVCLITGASGTTDIEGSLVTGAHGPGELQILVVDSHSL